MKKILATLLAMTMLFATTVAFAADPVPAETSANPKITLMVTDVMAADMEDGLGERTFAIVAATLTSDETYSIKKNSITQKITSGTGIASFTLDVCFDETIFNMPRSIVAQTDGVGSMGYRESDNVMNGGMAGDGVAMYVGTLDPIYSFYMELKDGYTTMTADDINAIAFAEVKKAEMETKTYASGTATNKTKYSSNAADTTRNYDFATQVGTGAPAPVDPTIKPDAGAEDANDAKTWTITVDKGYVAQNDVLVAKLTKTEADGTTDTQTVDLTVGFDVDDVEGGAGWAFDLKVRFKDAANRAKTTLAIAKKEAN